MIIYRNSDEHDEDYEGYDVQFHFTTDNCPLDTTLYVMADGVGDPNLVGNINDYFYKLKETPYFLSVKAIVSRLKKSGFNPELAKNLNAMKLFICEENNTNELLAINFAHELGKDFNTLNLQYYNAVLFIPYIYEDNKVKKRGDIYITTPNGDRQLIDSGLPSEYRYTLTVQEVLQQEKTRVEFKAEHNTKVLSTFETTFSALSIEEVEIGRDDVTPYVTTHIESPGYHPVQDISTQIKETVCFQERQTRFYSSRSSASFNNHLFFDSQSLQGESNNSGHNCFDTRCNRVN